ncbi:TRAP transporter small permease subunit [Roseivivax sp. CAU 1761]
MHHLLRAVRGANAAIMVLAGLILVAMMLLVTADIAASWLFGRPIVNVIEIVAFYLMVGIVFLPLGSTELAGEHIKTDVLVRTLPQLLQTALSLLTGLATVAVLVLLTHVSIDKALAATERREMMMGTTLIQIWPSRWLLPTGFGLYLVSVLVVLWRDLRHGAEA